MRSRVAVGIAIVAIVIGALVAWRSCGSTDRAKDILGSAAAPQGCGVGSSKSHDRVARTGDARWTRDASLGWCRDDLVLIVGGTVVRGTVTDVGGGPIGDARDALRRRMRAAGS